MSGPSSDPAPEPLSGFEGLDFRTLIDAHVAGVSEVAVVGRRHPMLDEVPVAFVIAARPADPELATRITAACASGLAPFKQPHEVRVVESLPRATLDKVAKAELRKIVAAEFGEAAGLSRSAL